MAAKRAAVSFSLIFLSGFTCGSTSSAVSDEPGRRVPALPKDHVMLHTALTVEKTATVATPGSGLDEELQPKEQRSKEQCSSFSEDDDSCVATWDRHKTPATHVGSATQGTSRFQVRTEMKKVVLDLEEEED
mmetsp:Transcript_64492/g.140414  ORF Transcript_64492/g.140414 Transcript_64492/m.140414 type:complete len:132 (-) Transcript_64492:98-493(-)